MFLRAFTLALVFLIPIGVLAYERQTIEIGDETYFFVVGSLDEPVMVDDKTGVSLRVTTKSSTGMALPVIGLEETLQVEIMADDKTLQLPLEASWGDAGAYDAPFYPTIATEYSYRFFGTINDVPVDMTFACHAEGHAMHGDADTERMELSDGVMRIEKAGGFGCPESREAVQFPRKTESLATLSREASNATNMATVALIFGIVGFIARKRKG